MKRTGRIRTYDGTNSLSEKFVMDINGGPGTDDYVFTDKYKDMKLEEDFTVVYWDYRDMGIAYDKSFDTGRITLENILKDTEAVTEYLKRTLS